MKLLELKISECLKFKCQNLYFGGDTRDMRQVRPGVHLYTEPESEKVVSSFVYKLGSKYKPRTSSFLAEARVWCRQEEEDDG